MRNGSPTLEGNDSLYSVEQMQLNALSELSIFTCVEGTKILLVDDQPTNLDVLCSSGPHWKEYSVTPSWKLFFCTGKLSDVLSGPLWGIHFVPMGFLNLLSNPNLLLFFYHGMQKTFILTHVKLPFLLQPLYNFGLKVYVTL